MAIAPPDVDPPLLEALTGAIDGSLDACLTSGMLTAATDGTVSFRHELALLAVEGSVAPRRRTMLHRRALETLAARPEPALDLARLAHHAEAAGNRDAVLRFAPAAGARASSVGAHREAAEQYARAQDWFPYQPTSFPTPPFAEYSSGHSNFSAAGAEILRLFTGSDRFGGSVTVSRGSSRVEPGLVPARDLTLTWPTFSDAAAQAGISRRYGGIHFTQGDLDARATGTAAARRCWARANTYFDGTAPVPRSPRRRFAAGDHHDRGIGRTK